MKHIIIIGATASLGRAIIAEAATAGNDIVLCGRDIDECERLASDARIRYGVRVAAYAFDAQDIAAHDALFARIAKSHGRAAGVIMLQGAMSGNDSITIPAGDVQRMAMVNFASVVSASHAVIAHNLSPGGYLAVVTSVAGMRGKKRNLVYNATKSAAITYLEGLRQAAPHIAVIDIRPGFVDTPLTYGSVTSVLTASRERVARDIMRGIRRRKRIIYTPRFWQCIMCVVRMIPGKIYDRIKL